MSYFLQMIKIAITHVWDGKTLLMLHSKHKTDKKITA